MLQGCTGSLASHDSPCPTLQGAPSLPGSSPATTAAAITATTLGTGPCPATNWELYVPWTVPGEDMGARHPSNLLYAHTPFTPMCACAAAQCSSFAHAYALSDFTLQNTS